MVYLHAHASSCRERVGRLGHAGRQKNGLHYSPCPNDRHSNVMTRFSAANRSTALASRDGTAAADAGGGNDGGNGADADAAGSAAVVPTVATAAPEATPWLGGTGSRPKPLRNRVQCFNSIRSIDAVSADTGLPNRASSAYIHSVYCRLGASVMLHTRWM